MTEKTLEKKQSVRELEQEFYELAIKQTKIKSPSKNPELKNHLSQKPSMYKPPTSQQSLEILINEDYFKLGCGDDNFNLIPYEITYITYLAWLSLKPGYKTNNPKKNHLLARLKQFRTAIKDDIGELLLNFYISKNPDEAKELRCLYEKAKKQY